MLRIFLFIVYLSLSLVCGQKILEKSVRPAEPVNETCLSIIRSNSSLGEKCEFFKCFERRFPCGAKYFTMNWGYKYCVKYADSAFQNRLSANGKFVANTLNTCLPKSFEKMYKQKRSIKCKNLYEDAFNQQAKCYSDIQERFCVGFTENKNVFMRVIEKADLMNSLLMNMMQKVVEPCEPKIDLMTIFFQG